MIFPKGKAPSDVFLNIIKSFQNSFVLHSMELEEFHSRILGFEAMIKQQDAMVEVIKFYAAKTNWESGYSKKTGCIASVTQKDMGRKARDFLKEYW